MWNITIASISEKTTSCCIIYFPSSLWLTMWFWVYHFCPSSVHKHSPLAGLFTVVSFETTVPRHNKRWFWEIHSNSHVTITVHCCHPIWLFILRPLGVPKLSSYAKAEDKLFKYLFGSYQKWVRPVAFLNQSICVRFGLAISQLVDVVRIKMLRFTM